MDLWVTGFSTVQIVTLTGCFLLGYTGGYLGPRWPCRTPVLLWFFSACVPHFFKAYTLLKDTELRSQRPVTQVDSGNTKQCLRRCTSHLCWSPPPSGHLAFPTLNPTPQLLSLPRDLSLGQMERLSRFLKRLCFRLSRLKSKGENIQGFLPTTKNW